MKHYPRNGRYLNSPRGDDSPPCPIPHLLGIYGKGIFIIFGVMVVTVFAVNARRFSQWSFPVAIVTTSVTWIILRYRGVRKFGKPR